MNKNNINENSETYNQKYNISIDNSITLTKDAFCSIMSPTLFVVFNSINKIQYLIYSNKENSIIAFNLNTNQKITEIKKAHKEQISGFNHCYYKNLEIDLIMSFSYKNNNIKVWNFNNWNCIFDLSNINKNGSLFSACFAIINNSNFYICSSNCSDNENNNEPIKIISLENKKIIKKINNSNDITWFINCYYENNNCYIISANNLCVKSFNFNENILYHKYYEKNSNEGNSNFCINNNKEKTFLIVASFGENIRIFDFHTGILFNKINFEKKEIYGICLLNESHLCVSYFDQIEKGCIKIYDYFNGDLIKNILLGNKNGICSIKQINLNEYGECLITQGVCNEQIKIFIKNNII